MSDALTGLMIEVQRDGLEKDDILNCTGAEIGMHFEKYPERTLDAIIFLTGHYAGYRFRIGKQMEVATRAVGALQESIVQNNNLIRRMQDDIAKLRAR